MAGNYPDAPSWRMAYDRDGTKVVNVGSDNLISELSSQQLRDMNDEGTGYYGPPNGSKTCFVFPELRDLDGVYVNWDGVGSYPGSYTSCEVSTNTTNGFDGTWTSLGTIGGVQGNPKPTYRNNIASTTVLGVRAVRFGVNTPISGGVHFRGIHLYGEPVPGANPNRLELWHPTLDEKCPPAYFDWGDVQRGSSADRQFRVKNLSSTQNANNIRVAMEALTDANPSVVAQHTLSHDGGLFTPQPNIGSLAPGAISSLLTLRRVTPTNATLSLWSFRLFAESTEWS